MRLTDDESEGTLHCGEHKHWITVCIGAIGIIAYGAALVELDRYQINVVTNSSSIIKCQPYWPARILAWAIPFVLAIMAVVGSGHKRGISRWSWMLRSLAPLALCFPIALHRFVDTPINLLWILLMVLGLGWSGLRVGSELRETKPWTHGHKFALGSIVVLVLLLTAIHTVLQNNFFEHFMLGHADFGHFTEELKNCLQGRGLRSYSFDNVRLGWHFVPLMYLLVPGYALWPSPVYLMACGAFFVHAVAIVVYFFGKNKSSSVLVGWLFALAWLLLPSVSRLVYSGTYGFQWIYVAMPILGGMVAYGVTGRWILCLVMAGLLMLSKETACAATFGWGVYLLLFSKYRKSGALLAVVSVGYLLLCVKVLIPHFAESGAYQRFSLFGELGSGPVDLLVAPLTNPYLFVGRLVRPQALFFVAMLLVPMAMLPLRGWKVSVASIPTLLLVLLLDNGDWLSIKYWHQATILPFLFFAGMSWMKEGDNESLASGLWSRFLYGQRKLSQLSVNRGAAVALVVCAAMGHYLFAFSPLSKSFEMYASNQAMHVPHPNQQIVQHLRESLPHDRTVLATERLAAHFTDFYRVYTGQRPHDADYVIIDPMDRWDGSGLPQRVDEYLSNPDYRLMADNGRVVVFGRVSDSQ